MYNIRAYNDSDLINLKDCEVLLNSLNKNAKKYIIELNNEFKGFVIIDMISAMNEYKLGKMYFNFLDNDYSLLKDNFLEMLNYEIIENYFIKMTIDLDVRDSLKIDFLRSIGFLEVKTENGVITLKMTKPIFLSRR